MSSSFLHFSPFRLDPSNERLWDETQGIPLRPKTFAVLRYLVEHAEQLVTKDELLSAVWLDTVVGDDALTGCIRDLRKVLGDEAKMPRYIETVHRRGYRFLLPVTTQPVPDFQLQVPSREEGASSQPSVVSGQEEESQKADRGSLLSSVQSLEANGQSLESRVQSQESESQTSTLPPMQPLEVQPSILTLPARRFGYRSSLILLGLLLLVGSSFAVHYLFLSHPSPPPHPAPRGWRCPISLLSPYCRSPT